MKLLKTPWNRILTRSWTIAGAALGLLIVAILVANLVLIRENDQVLAMVRQMLQYDIEIEDEGDDLRVAVLDMRHFQRDIMFDGPSNAALTTYDQAYARLLEEIADLERLGLDGLDVMPPERFRELTEQYYNEFRAATG
jgi:two-component system sensor histidine kinase VicK